MILASPERIREYTAEGYWGTETLWDRFRQYARAHPDRVALVDPPNKEELVGFYPERLTYRELEQAVGAVAQALVDRGLRKDDVVMVQLPNVWELAMLYLAVARAGGVIAPIPVQWRAKEFSYIAGLTEAAMFITTRQFRGFSGLDMARQLQGQLPALREILTLEDVREMARGAYDEERLGAIPMDANDIFTICWTSGTEAEPKGCPLSHNNWL
ncbi:AMP-binding protein, partial [Kyrpidia sp.]|uniref:AMP-binding protein n=1 Tax=Kyrpidia sp. TaxID=2073077 RepID=UPI002582953D